MANDNDVFEFAEQRFYGPFAVLLKNLYLQLEANLKSKPDAYLKSYIESIMDPKYGGDGKIYHLQINGEFEKQVKKLEEVIKEHNKNIKDKKDGIYYSLSYDKINKSYIFSLGRQNKDKVREMFGKILEEIYIRDVEVTAEKFQETLQETDSYMEITNISANEMNLIKDQPWLGLNRDDNLDKQSHSIFKVPQKNGTYNVYVNNNDLFHEEKIEDKENYKEKVSLKKGAYENSLLAKTYLCGENGKAYAEKMNYERDIKNKILSVFEKKESIDKPIYITSATDGKFFIEINNGIMTKYVAGMSHGTNKYEKVEEINLDENDKENSLNKALVMFKSFNNPVLIPEVTTINEKSVLAKDFCVSHCITGEVIHECANVKGEKIKTPSISENNIVITMAKTKTMVTASAITKNCCGVENTKEEFEEKLPQVLSIIQAINKTAKKTIQEEINKIDEAWEKDNCSAPESEKQSYLTKREKLINESKEKRQLMIDEWNTTHPNPTENEQKRFDEDVKLVDDLMNKQVQDLDNAWNKYVAKHFTPSDDIIKAHQQELFEKESEVIKNIRSQIKEDFKLDINSFKKKYNILELDENLYNKIKEDSKTITSTISKDQGLSIRDYNHLFNVINEVKEQYKEKPIFKSETFISDIENDVNTDLEKYKQEQLNVHQEMFSNPILQEINSTDFNIPEEEIEKIEKDEKDEDTQEL